MATERNIEIYRLCKLSRWEGIFGRNGLLGKREESCSCLFCRIMMASIDTKDLPLIAASALFNSSHHPPFMTNWGPEYQTYITVCLKDLSLHIGYHGGNLVQGVPSFLPLQLPIIILRLVANYQIALLSDKGTDAHTDSFIVIDT